MGRQVAGQAFLEAYLSHGSFSDLTALLRQRAPAPSLVELWREHSANRPTPRTLRIIGSGDFHRTFFPAPPATILHSPQPPDPAFAWARSKPLHTPSPSLESRTHFAHWKPSTCSGRWSLRRSRPTTPLCAPRAVASMVREVTQVYADHLRARLGVRPAKGPAAPIPIRLETIPLGVDIDRFRPATLEERAMARRSLSIAKDEVAILYVGHLSHHAKAHPFPLFRGASEAAAAAGRKVHVILAGWAAHPAVHDAFVEGARLIATGVRTSIIDGRDPGTRREVWHAADVFVSPSDNIQETFGLAVLEAMASGLPVVASDWDGYRDLVVDGQTGLLVPTAMVEGATSGATARLLTGELTYDHFLAEISQATVVDVPAMGAALARLVDDPAMRHQMGEAGRRRACERFAWNHVIHLYEELWQEQESERSAWAGRQSLPPSEFVGPAAYPDIERSFAGYPIRCLDGAERIVPAPARSTGWMCCSCCPWPTTPLRAVSPTAASSAAPLLLPCSVGDLDRFWLCRALNAAWAVQRSPGCSSTTWSAALRTIDPPEGLFNETNPG